MVPQRRLARVFEAERPGRWHPAAQASVGRSVTDPARRQRNIVRAGPEAPPAPRGAGHLSIQRRGLRGTDVIPPGEPPSLPISPYGITKVAVEQYVAAWIGIYGISGISLRYANIYGPRQNPQGEAGVIAIFCHRLLTGQVPIINGDGGQTRDYTYVEDVAAANLRALERPDVTGAVNVCTGVETREPALPGAGAGVGAP